MEVDKTKMALLILMLSQQEVSKTALNKLVFFADYCYSSKYGNFEETITNDNYIKLQYGPVPDNIEEVRNYCVAKGYLKKEVKKIYTRLGSYYTLNSPLEKLNTKEILNDEERDSVNLVYEKLAGYNSASLSYFSHVIEPWRSSEFWSKLSPMGMSEDIIYDRWDDINNLYDLLKQDKHIEIINER